MKILFLVEDEGEEGGLLKKQTNERSVNGNPDFGKKKIKDTENGKNKITSNSSSQSNLLCQ